MIMILIPQLLVLLGTYQFEWTVSNGSCSNANDKVTIIITPVSDLELTKTVLPTERKCW